MAADTRKYKSKEQDGQGNEIILRDQQLVEQTSQTTMASGEYFEIVDVDGRMAKIPKANMVDIVREALGSLLNGLTDQTTVTKVPSLNGNTLGASTVATLASVLGATLQGNITSITNIDSLPNGVYNVTENNSYYEQVTNPGFFVKRDFGERGYMIAIHLTGSTGSVRCMEWVIRVKFSSSWQSSWVKYTGTVVQ